MLKWLPYILIGHCISLSPWCIILDKNNVANVSYHDLTSGGYHVCLLPMSYGFIGMYWVKCKQTQCLTTYVHIFFCLTGIRTWPNLSIGDHGHVICMVNLGEVYSQENTAEGQTENHKCYVFFINK